MPFRRPYKWLTAEGWAATALVVGLLAIAIAYGYLAVEWYNTKQDVVRITRVVEGTPGPQGQPGVGIHRATITELPHGANATIRLSQGILYVGLPRGSTGPAGLRGALGPRGRSGTNGSDGTDGTDGARGPTGRTGPKGATGLRGAQGPQGVGSPTANIAAAVDAFMGSHTFICTRVTGRTYSCVVS